MARTARFFRMSFLLFPALILCVSSAAAQAQSSSQQQNPPQSTAVKQAVPPEAQPAARTPRQEAEMRADLFMARKEYADAAGAYAELLKKEPRNAVLLNKLGVAYHLQGNLGQAKKYYDKAAKADRNFANAYNNLGTVFYQRRKYSKAIPNYLKAVGIDPQMSVGYSNLGYAYFHMKKYDEALGAFRQALAIDPEIFDRSSRGGSLLQDRTVMADRGLFYFFLAKSFASRGDAAQCVRYLKRAQDEGYKDLLSARTDAAFKPVLRDPDVRLILQLEPLPPEPKTNIAP